MSSLIVRTSRKSAAASGEEARVMRARAGHASFARSFADMAGNTVETGPHAAAFLSGMGGSFNAPTVKAEKSVHKADVLEALPANAKKAVERFDDGVKAFVNMFYQRHAKAHDALDFTDAEAAQIMGRDAHKARKCVEALASAGILKPSYRMGILSGYVPGFVD